MGGHEPAAAEGDAEKDTGIHLFVDEVQFLDKPYFAGDFHLVVHSLLQAGHTVTCGGLDLDWRGLPFEVTARLLAMADHVTKLTARCNVTGQPALAMPSGFTADGLPLSMQLIGRPFEEPMVYRVAAAYEAATGWTKRLPPGI